MKRHYSDEKRISDILCRAIASCLIGHENKYTNLLTSGVERLSCRNCSAVERFVFSAGKAD